MKKYLCLLLILMSAILFAACARESELDEIETQNGTTAETVWVNEAQPEAPYLKKTVTFSIPLSFISDKDRADLDSYCKANGYKRIEINEKNGTAKIEMPKFSHQLLLTKIGMDTIKSIYDIFESGYYFFFKSIESYDEKNFREIVITVDGDSFRRDSFATVLTRSLAQCCYKYQAYSTITYYRCKIIVKDAESGTVISDETYAL